MRTLLLILILLCISLPSFGQLAIPGAGEDKFGLLNGGKAITVTTSDTKLGFNWTRDSHLTSDDDCKHLQRGTSEYQMCLEALLNKSQNFFTLNVGITGEKGKRSIFSDGKITPGAEVGFVGTHRWELASANHGGYTDFYGGGTASAIPLKVSNIGTVSSFDTKTETTFGVTTGLNVFLRENFGIGIGAVGKRDLQTPGLQDPSTLCTITASGTNKDGNAVQVSSCDDGFAGPLTDAWVGSLRLDVLKNFTRKPEKGSAVAALGLLGSVNVSGRTATGPVYNVAFGPTLHPKGAPQKVLLAIIASFSDLTDANNKGKTTMDKFGVKLYFGVPLTGF